jgi:small subunit ribosomal protein S3
MGQKVIPIGFRLVRNRKWRSMWYASKQDFGKLLVEDQRIREHLRKRPSTAGVSSVNIRRMSDKIEITVRSSRPGLVIGKKGVEIDQLRKELRALTGKEVWIEVEEIKRAEMDAKSVADNIARQLERRMPFRRVMKKSLQATKEAGALGVKIRVSGRLGGAEIARAEWYKDGQVPLHTIKADIDYATARAQTTYGIIGVKVWINHGEEEIGL